MADLNNVYTGQVVTAVEINDWHGYLETADHDLAHDHGLAQAKTTDSPDAETFGGINEGLVASWDAVNSRLNLTAGICYDDDGQRIYIPACTIKLTNAGLTTVGDTSEATATGALITSACPVGQRIVVSLYAVYDELPSDPRVDAGGTSLYYLYSESFKFNIAIGVAFAHPPGAAPTRNALSNSQVLIADLVLTNNAGTMEVIAGGVCVEDQNWDDLGGFYADNNGRRSDWLTCDQGANYPQNDALGLSLRAQNARDALNKLIKNLQRQVEGVGLPAGSRFIGAPAYTPSSSAPAFAATALPVGSLEDQLIAIAAALSSKVARGSDTMQPPVNTAGLTLDPDLQEDITKPLLQLYADNGGTSAPYMLFGSRGHITKPNIFEDDFHYTPAGTGLYTFGANTPWGINDVVGGINAVLPVPTTMRGGWIRIQGGAVNNSHIQVISGYNGGAYIGEWFNVGGTRGFIFEMRFRITNVGGTVNNRDVTYVLGFRTGTGENLQLVYNDQQGNGAPDTNLYLNMEDTFGSAQINLGPIAMDERYTFRCAVVGAKSVAYSLRGDASGLLASAEAAVFGGATVAFEDDAYACYLDVTTGINNVSAAPKYLDVDRVFASPGQLATDMI